MNSDRLFVSANFVIRLNLRISHLTIWMEWIQESAVFLQNTVGDIFEGNE